MNSFLPRSHFEPTEETEKYWYSVYFDLCCICFVFRDHRTADIFSMQLNRMLVSLVKIFYCLGTQTLEFQENEILGRF